MTDILEKLFRGNLCPIEYVCTQDKEYTRKREQYAQSRKALIDVLRRTDDSLIFSLEALESQKENIGWMENIEAFRVGFCLGVSIMQEVSQHMAEEF